MPRHVYTTQERERADNFPLSIGLLAHERISLPLSIIISVVNREENATRLGVFRIDLTGIK